MTLMDYIDRTIKFIESSNKSNVLAIIVFPYIFNNDKMVYGFKNYSNDIEYKRKIELLVGNFKKPVYKLGEMDSIDKVVKDIIDFFQEE